MAPKKRKLGFYYLTLNTAVLDINSVLIETLINIDNYSDLDRKINLNDAKFGLMSNIESFNKQSRHQLRFKSAKHSYRPPLLDSLTAGERESPKKIEEGDRDKTHIITKAVNGDVIVLLEKFQGSVTVKQFVYYLNSFAKDIDGIAHKFSYETIAKDDFLEELNSLSRVVCADVFVDKQILGGDALNYSERTHTVQHEVMLTVKANRGSSIKGFVQDTFAAINGGKIAVRRMRVVGRTKDNNERKINTDFIEKQEYIAAVPNGETGELQTDDVFTEMEAVIYNY
jgi:hypothetical protein